MTSEPQRAAIRVVLICHAGAELHRRGIARWLASFSTLAGIVEIHEPSSTLWRRVRRELARVGFLRFLDVLAFRLYSRVVLARRDNAFMRSALQSLETAYPGSDAPEIRVASPNSVDAEAFIRDAKPDLVLALCKNILAERVFSIPRAGTFVLHPGICPEYRNAHGCFWALAARDLGNVGVTLLRIDRGIDTGPIFGYYRYAFDESRESHTIIQHRSVLENLDAIAGRLRAVVNGEARAIPVEGRRSAVWGQPWLTQHVRWKWSAAAERYHATDSARVS